MKYLVLLFAVSSCLPSHCLANAVRFRTVALPGDPAPGISGAKAFHGFSGPVALNSYGQVAFRAFLSPDDWSYDSPAGIWSEGNGSLGLKVFDGDHAPGIPNDALFHISGMLSASRLSLSDDGRIAFNSQLAGDVTYWQQSIWSERTGALRLVARDGDPAPGTPYQFRLSDESFVFNSAGNVSFSAFLVGSVPSQMGAWTDAAGHVELVRGANAQAPGFPSGVWIDTAGFSYETIPLNSNGQFAFSSEVIGPATYRNSILSNRSGTFELIAVDGENAPGTQAKFSEFGYTALNSAGKMIFPATLGQIEDGGGYQGIWSESAESLNLLARLGDPAPGASEGAKFSHFSGWALNSVGQAVIVARLQGTGINASNEKGIWIEDNGALSLVARTGDAAPSTDFGVRFKDFSAPLPSTNDVRMRFYATLTGNGVNESNDASVWIQNPDGSLQMILREGDALEVGQGDNRVVRGFEMGGFNDRGQMAFTIGFIDGTNGIFVSNPMFVPEPELAQLISLAICSLFAARRRPRLDNV